MTGMLTLTAAGQNQSAVPSVSQPVCMRLKVWRMPSIPGWSRQVASASFDFGSPSRSRPITAKRCGHFFTASNAYSLR